MKTKLLKKVRKNYIIEKRNTEYRLICLNGKFEQESGWTYLDDCIDRRREHILNDARKYKVPKSIVK